MSVEALSRGTIATPLEALDYGPLLKWLVLNGLALFGLFATWETGLLQLMVQSDRSYISLAILFIYAAMTVHSLWESIHVSRELNSAHRTAAQVKAEEGLLRVVGDDLVTSGGHALPRCMMTHHFMDLLIKDRLQGHAKMDQTILLQSLAEQIQQRNRIGWFVANTLLKLGLLGTVIGFILMLSPISAIEAYDVGALKTALTTMSGGMAIALFTTLAGLVAGILLTLQYYLLDGAASTLFALITEVSEVYVVPSLEKSHAISL